MAFYLCIILLPVSPNLRLWQASGSQRKAHDPFSLVSCMGLHRTKKRICIKFAWCKYVANMKFAKLCNQCKGGNGRICTKKRANSAIATFALVAKLCKFHICNIFAPGKFGANSIFHPVLGLQKELKFSSVC